VKIAPIPLTVQGEKLEAIYNVKEKNYI